MSKAVIKIYEYDLKLRLCMYTERLTFSNKQKTEGKLR